MNKTSYSFLQTLVYALFCLFVGKGVAQQERICFWNIENFFDTYRDSLIADQDFTPEGLYRWTPNRFRNKKNNLYKTILALGSENKPPAIVGLGEVENERVLKELCFNTPLSKYLYGYIHFESADARGIDVALLYRKKHFFPIASESIPVCFDDDACSRDLLKVTGVLFDQDTVCLYVVHLPSKRGGRMGDVRREVALKKLKIEYDKTKGKNYPHLIMGDFNEDANSELIQKTLNSYPSSSKLENPSFINLTAGKLNTKGSYKYKSHWSTIDQIHVDSLFYTSQNLRIKGETAFIFSPNFLLIPDKKWMGYKPFRTYNGIQYLGGYSDHLPVYIDIEKAKGGALK